MSLEAGLTVFNYGLVVAFGFYLCYTARRAQ